jgi:hypothetical protein
MRPDNERSIIVDCFDCTINDRQPAAAIAICVNCGAAVCVSCARVESRPAPRPASVGNPTTERTRAVMCASCDKVLHHSHGAVLRAREDALR